MRNRCTARSAAEHRCEPPRGGCPLVVEQSALGQQEGARAGRTRRGAGSRPALQGEHRIADVGLVKARRQGIRHLGAERGNEHGIGAPHRIGRPHRNGQALGRANAAPHADQRDLDRRRRVLERGRDFLAAALPLANAEAGTTAWFALKFGPSTFGVFDAFADETGRNAHLNGPIAAALMANAAALLSEAPKIEKIDLLAAKLPG